MKQKKLMSFMLSLALIVPVTVSANVTSTPNTEVITASAEEYTPATSFKFDLNADDDGDGYSTAAITDYVGDETVVNIPPTIGSGNTIYTVTKINTYRLFGGNTNITSVTIPDTVTYINSDLFYGCTNLTTVKLPTGITEINGSMFQNCSSLTDVTIHEGIKSIGWYAFEGCNSLKSITLPSTITGLGSESIGYIKDESGEYVPMEGFVIYYYASEDGKSDAVVQEYALNNGFTAVCLNEDTPTTTTTTATSATTTTTSNTTSPTTTTTSNTTSPTTATTTSPTMTTTTNPTVTTTTNPTVTTTTNPTVTTTTNPTVTTTTNHTITTTTNHTVTNTTDGKTTATTANGKDTSSPKTSDGGILPLALLTALMSVTAIVTNKNKK